jgi:hypothetical protein
LQILWLDITQSLSGCNALGDTTLYTFFGQGVIKKFWLQPAAVGSLRGQIDIPDSRRGPV